MMTAQEVLDFWFEPRASTAEEFGQKLRRWYMGGAELDQEIAQRFGELAEQALDGVLNVWAESPEGRLALVLLLDQFPRNLHRDGPRAFEGDERAQALAGEAIDLGMHRGLPVEQRMFLVMPLLHAENLAHQERAAKLMEELAADAPPHLQAGIAQGVEQSRKYLDVIARFGRFPHRNQTLGRASTPEEVEFLRAWKERQAPAGQRG